MGVHEDEVLPFLQGETKNTCTNDKIINWQHEQYRNIVKGTVCRLDMQGVIRRDGLDSKWYNVQVQINTDKEARMASALARGSSRRSERGSKVGKPSATVATVLIEEGVKLNPYKIRAVFMHAAFPYDNRPISKGGTTNQCYMYKDGTTSKCRDTEGKEEEYFQWKDFRRPEDTRESGSEDEPEIEPDIERGKPGTSKAKKARQDSFKQSLKQWEDQ